MNTWYGSPKEKNALLKFTTDGWLGFPGYVSWLELKKLHSFPTFLSRCNKVLRAKPSVVTTLNLYSLEQIVPGIALQEADLRHL
ncbi:hypothetical protein Pmani_008864 [Petrolisthes manimaculis]|uniref:Uncharacterized protein n=1 Tax=Petrolisthes manimaculis TaxID=1843537 RepID=A0AAE1UIH9_9EUCA|nr:hypothetical protein Pmani_008864 [Petrolisthes manimaculis]